MSQEPLPPTGKKHRVIHWNPEAGREQNKRRWTVGRILKWSVGGLVALLALTAVTTRTIRFFNPDAFASFSGTAQTAVVEDLNTAFINQSRAEALFEQATGELDQIRRLPTEHPRQQAEIILIQKSYDSAALTMRNRRYAEAYTQLETIRRQMDEFARSIRAKQEVTTGLDSILVRIREIEVARDLAPELHDAAYTAAAEARMFNQNGSYLEASRTLQSGNDRLDQIQAALNAFVTSNIQRGAQALLRGEKEIAANAFRAVLQRMPDNEAALTGLNRSENIDRVYALLLQGEGLEAENRYAEAAEAYRRAAELDSLSTAAQQGQARAIRLDRESRFNAAFNAAQDAFQRRDWPTVMSQGQAALQVEPGNSNVQQMLVSAREEAHKDSVTRALERAQAHERVYQWEEARAAYLELQDLEPGHRDAEAGVIRAGEIIRAIVAYNQYVDSAEQLANQGEFQLAISMWNNAVANKPGYLAFDDRTTRLQAYLTEQNQPVTISLVSDSDTNVTIIGAAQYGTTRFKNETFQLYPGNYEIVGSRRNYRDVRIPIQVRYGSTPPVVTVICTVSARI
jgi:hypothetical protein